MFYIHQEQKGEWRWGQTVPLPLFCKGKRYLQTPMMFRKKWEGWLESSGEEGGG